MRVSKADGSQVLDLQRDALIAAGLAERNLYSDTASGKLDNRPGLESCLKACVRATRSSSGSSIALAGACATWSMSCMTSPSATSASGC